MVRFISLLSTLSNTLYHIILPCFCKSVIFNHPWCLKPRRLLKIRNLNFVFINNTLIYTALLTYLSIAFHKDCTSCVLSYSEQILHKALVFHGSRSGRENNLFSRLRNLPRSKNSISPRHLRAVLLHRMVLKRDWGELKFCEPLFVYAGFLIVWRDPITQWEHLSTAHHTAECYEVLQAVTALRQYIWGV